MVVAFVVFVVVLLVVRPLNAVFQKTHNFQDMNFKSCIPALRLRTIPLSLAGVSLGAMLAAADYHVDWKVAAFLLLTAVFLQMLSAHKSKVLTVSAALSGMTVLFFSFGTLFCMESLLLMVLGYFVFNMILKRKDMMDIRLRMIMNFIAYGVAGVFGTYCLCTHVFAPSLVLLPSVAVGSFAMAVLHLEDERDIRIWQTVLVLMGWAAMLTYASLRIFDQWHYLFVLTLPLYIWHLVGVWKDSGRALDKYRPLLVLSTFAFAILSGLGFLVYLF